jgi:CRISPR-associated endoribonuclease Cas6
LQTHDFNSLTLARYEFRLRAQVNAVLPAFLGSTFRGAFGYALKAVACSMSHGECGRCLLAERCLYPMIFETTARQQEGLLQNRQNAPRPFIFQSPFPIKDGVAARTRSRAGSGAISERTHFGAGEELKFGLTLIGAAIENLPYIVYAISLMVRHGLGVNRAPFELEEVSALDASGAKTKVYAPEMTRMRPHTAALKLGDLVEARCAQLPTRDDLALRFLTPTRIRVKNRVQETLSFEKLISSLSLRVVLLAETHGVAPLDYNHQTLLSRAREVEMRASHLWQCQLDRFSNRQQAKLELDGLMGEIVYAGPSLRELLPLVVAGEFLHVGSGTAFGLGHYRIEA